MSRSIYIFFAAAFLSLTACAQDAAQESSLVQVLPESFIVEPIPGQASIAGYLVLQNPSEKAHSLVSVMASDFQHIMLHDNEHKDGMMQMTMVSRLPIAAGATVAMEQGGLHLMMMGFPDDLAAGDTVTLLLNFADNSQVETDVAVISFAESRQR